MKHWMGGPFSAPDHVHLTAGIMVPLPTVGKVGGGVTPLDCTRDLGGERISGLKGRDLGCESIT